MSCSSKYSTKSNLTLTPRHINPCDVNDEGIVWLVGAVDPLLHFWYADSPCTQVPKAGCESLKATNCLTY